MALPPRSVVTHSKRRALSGRVDGRSAVSLRQGACAMNLAAAGTASTMTGRPATGPRRIKRPL
ncbi:hypothetical protein ACFOX2_08775 [Corynebacterium marambiense]|uniref:hypothetical protein n=1 Tax=Corynebacterium marambiense TaxID=2765364 RepID=UPI00360F4670